jgi:cation transport ATPase
MPGVDERELLRVAAAVESVSSHPIAHAVVVAAAARGIEVPPLRGPRALEC